MNRSLSFTAKTKAQLGDRGTTLARQFSPSRQEHGNLNGVPGKESLCEACSVQAADVAETGGTRGPTQQRAF